MNNLTESQKKFLKFCTSELEIINSTSDVCYIMHEDDPKEEFKISTILAQIYIDLNHDEIGYDHRYKGVVNIYIDQYKAILNLILKEKCIWVKYNDQTVSKLSILHNFEVA